MKEQTFIFVGRSGCGKGTQALLLKEYLHTADSVKRDVMYVEVGASFREFIQQNNLTSRLSRTVYEQGELQPEFIAIYIWSKFFTEHLKGEEHLILDGTPRRLREALVLDNALKFYKRTLPVIVFINVSEVWSKTRLMERGRVDDRTKEEVARRMKWYEIEVLPVIEFFKDSRTYKFLDINGEQSIEAVQKEIIEKFEAVV
jgi:adenylate kinase family enzyme